MTQPSLASTRISTPSTHGGGIFCTLDDLIKLQYGARKLATIPVKQSYATLSGSYSSPFKGRGVDFSEVRLYQAGDDIRTIDWRVTARTGKTHTKLFTEERERPVIFTLDLGPSMFFGTRAAFKSVVATRICALLAWSSFRTGDKVGLLLNLQERHHELKPTGGKKGVLRLLRTMADATQKIATFTESPDANKLKETILRLKRVARPGSLMFIVSDFYGFDNDAQLHLATLARHTTIVMIQIYDPIERHAPPPGVYSISNGKQITKFNAYDAKLTGGIREAFNTRQSALKSFAIHQGIHFCAFATNEIAEDDFVKRLYDRIPILRNQG